MYKFYFSRMLFVLATSVSSSAIITDRHSGIWDRVLVQGKFKYLVFVSFVQRVNFIYMKMNSERKKFVL